MKFVNEKLEDILKPKSGEEILASMGDFVKIYSPNYLLRKSIEAGLLQGIKKALELGADKEIMHRGESLRRVAKNGFIEIVKFFIKNGVEANPYPYWTLRSAAEGDHYDVVKFLIDSGANPRDDEFIIGTTAENERIEILKLLLKRGADINGSDDYALRIVIEKEKSIEVIKFLLDNGANANSIKGRENDEYLYQLTKRPEIVRLLQQYESVNEKLEDILKPKSEEEIKEATKKFEEKIEGFLRWGKDEINFIKGLNPEVDREQQNEMAIQTSHRFREFFYSIPEWMQSGYEDWFIELVNELNLFIK